MKRQKIEIDIQNMTNTNSTSGRSTTGYNEELNNIQNRTAQTLGCGDDIHKNEKVDDNGNHDDDDDKSVQTQLFAIDEEATQQYSSLNDDTQPYSMIEIDDDESMENEIHDHDDDKEKDEKKENDNDSEKVEKSFNVTANDSFNIASPPFSTMKNVTERTSKATLNQSCAIPIGSSPKLSPIALIGSQQSDPAATADSTTDKLLLNGQSELSFANDGDNNDGNNMEIPFSFFNFVNHNFI